MNCSLFAFMYVCHSASGSFLELSSLCSIVAVAIFLIALYDLYL